MDYNPTASIAAAKARADMYRNIRAFFSMKDVLEVETPALSHAGATDVNLQSVIALFSSENKATTGYLHTSPEFAMKRLVAAWQEPIYQIAKVFRDNESGTRHNIEFSMLEWYRPSFNLDQLAEELSQLLGVLLGKAVVFDRMSYRQAFLDYADIEPFSATIDELEQVAIFRGLNTSLMRSHEYVSVMANEETHSDSSKSQQSGTNDLHNLNAYANLKPSSDLGKRIAAENASASKEDWLDLLFSHLVEPELGKKFATLVYDYPASQAALAKTREDAHGNVVAERFELYINGLEIANAYHELTDASVQRQRFKEDNDARKEKGIPRMPIDEKLLAALADMPACSGISVGLDRLLMVMLETNQIDDVIAFPTEYS